MSRLIDEVVQKLERLQLIHGMSAGKSYIYISQSVPL